MQAKYIGESGQYEKDQPYAITVQKMSGRLYKPGKGTNGKWLDTEGTPDNRYMVWGMFPSVVEYKVYESADAVIKDWLFVEYQKLN